MGADYEFINKTIFIISYEEWGDMLMSKHHYAIELGKKGNKVYFINHPDRKYRLKRGEIKISKTDFKNVFSVAHRLIHPYFLKYKVKWLYNFLTGLHISKIIRKIGFYPEVVWSFDIGNSIPIKYFPKSKYRIYMPVDGPFGSIDEMKAVKKADIILSVSDEILNSFCEMNLVKVKINHGVAEEFINKTIVKKMTTAIKVGYSGSLLRGDIDIETLKEIITTHLNVKFEFWGECDPLNSTIHFNQDISIETIEFLEFLKNCPNVVLHGTQKPNKLASGLKDMDILLVAYKPTKDNTQNSHKILEYLGTGKVIVSSFMSAYANNYEMINMVSRESAKRELVKLFTSVIDNLDVHNCETYQQRRVDFAQQFTYSKQIEKIEKLLC